MSDSDEDFMQNNIFKYQHERTGFQTKKPNRNNNTLITSYSIRNNNMMTSTFEMQNYENQRYRDAFDQRSMGYRREPSPISLRSLPDRGKQHFHSSYYPHGMSSRRSVFNGRCGSPMSVRSIATNATNVSAVDIALAFKNVNYNERELSIIEEAYRKFKKNRVRKRMERKRKLKLFLKGTRRDTGYDSGEQGSVSSISSDDCRSTRTEICKENLPTPRSRLRPKSSKTDMTQLRNTIRESDMYQDCTENFKQNSFRNMLVVKNTQVNNSAVSNTTIAKPQNGSLVSLKDRFKKGNPFVLPLQRFTRLGNKINDGISRSRSMQTRQTMCNMKEPTNNKRGKYENNSGNEEIFPEVTVRENVQESTLLQRKRNFDLEEANYSDRKRKKFTSPIKHTSDSLISSTLINTQNNDFTFKKPQMPVGKSIRSKDTIFNDKLIAKSAPPLLDDVEPDFSLHSNKQVKNKDTTIQYKSTHVPQNKESEDTNNETEISQNTTDVSMKPSFIKRKLFSQKLDVLDKKNVSSDNILNSPQTKLYAGEKHKVRKLASSQSCLNLGVLANDNVLDLIHKIVPCDKINITNTHNKKEIRKSQDDDKWDVTSVISMCNNEDVSDTYTDEEIFKVPQSTTSTKVNNKTNKVINSNSETNRTIETKNTTKQKVNEMPKNRNITKQTKPEQCKVILNNLSLEVCNNYYQDKPIQSQNKRSVSSFVNSFWDTDFESDMDEQTHYTSSSNFAAVKIPENNSVNNTINLPKKNVLKSNILTVRSTQSKGINSSSRSDRSKVSQRPNQKENQETKEPIKKDTLNKKSNCKINSITSVTEVKNKRGKPKDVKKPNSAQKCSSKSKETCNKQKKGDAVKNNELNKIRILTPRKVNENKRKSSPKSNESSFNCSNISSRSLRIRKNKPEYKI